MPAGGFADMVRTHFTPAFIPTRNVRSFEVLMNGLALGEGEGRLGAVSGRAGLGKTRTAQRHAAHNGCVFMRVVGPMLASETQFAEGLCREMKLAGVPRRSGAMFYAIVDKLQTDSCPVFIDEADRLRPKMLDFIRDLSDLSTSPFVLIGEEELDTVMGNLRRVRSRGFQAMRFEPVGAGDIVLFVKQSTGLDLQAEPAAMMLQQSEGDWRPVKSATLSLVQQVNGTGKTEITTQMVKNAFKVGLGGFNGSAKK